MNAATKQDLLANLAALPRMASAWIMSLAGLLGAIWFALPPEQQQTLLSHSALPVWSYPIVLTAVGIVARIWPQKGFTAGVAPASTETTTTTGAKP